MDETVQKIVARIAESIHPERIFLFGSRVTDTPGHASDIDLLVLYRGAKAPREVQVEIHRLFDQRGLSLDVFVLRIEDFEAQKNVANTLAREVSERGVVCYG